jgi:hypothetical protein
MCVNAGGSGGGGTDELLYYDIISGDVSGDHGCQYPWQRGRKGTDLLGDI